MNDLNLINPTICKLNETALALANIVLYGESKNSTLVLQIKTKFCRAQRRHMPKRNAKRKTHFLG